MRLVRSLVLATFAAFGALALNNGAALTPQLGWSSWCADGQCGLDYCSEKQVKETAQALLSNGMYALGYRWILLDDCWAADNRTAEGTITWDPTRFPNGIPALVQWLHGKNISFGLYTSAGNQTCDSGGRPHPIPGSEGHYQLDFNTFASWDVDYVKADWCGDVKKMPLDGLLVGAKDYEAISSAATNTNPAKTIFIMGVAARIFLLNDVPQFMNAWRAASDHHDNWKNTVEVLATVQLTGIPSAPGAWSDMDVLMTGGQGCRNRRYVNNDTSHCPGMSDEEYITEFSMWNLMQSPLNVATDIRNMTAIMNRILLNRRFLEIHQDTRTGPGNHRGGDDKCGYLFGDITCQIWTRTLYDDSMLVVLYNAQLETSLPSVPITFEFDKYASKLGWGANTSVVVEDLWDSSNTGTVATGKFVSKPIAPHSVVAVVLHRQS